MAMKLYMFIFFLLCSLVHNNNAQSLDDLVKTYGDAVANSSDSASADDLRSGLSLLSHPGSAKCLQKLAPCKEFIHYEGKPPSSCCDPIAELVGNDTEGCLCILNNDGLLHTANVTKEEVISLVTTCGSKPDLSECPDASAAGAPSGSMTSSASISLPPVPMETFISKTLTTKSARDRCRRILLSSSFSTAAAAAGVGHSSAFQEIPTSSAPPPPQEQRSGGSKWSRWLLFLPGAATFGLGSWQIVRRQEKIKVLEHRQKRLALEPVKLNDPSPSDKQLDALEFRRVSCKGVYDEDRSIYVGPRSRSISGVTENGYYVVTPLMPVPGNPESVKSPILVNRGWVPRIWRDRSFEAASQKHPPQPDTSTPTAQETKPSSSRWRLWSKKQQPETTKEQPPSVNPVEVVGVIRGSENPSAFVPANDPSSGQWFYIDVPAIAASCGLPDDTVYVEDVHEDVNPSCPYPVPKDVSTLIRSSVMPQDHLNYTLTWYSLSAAVTFMAYKRLKQKQPRR
ncbi:Surfeit locus protein 1 [Linum perenne]